jgi:hypothetical protein
MQREENDLLDQVREQGWNDSSRREFLQRYGLLIRRSILYHIRRCFGAAQMHALSDHLKALQGGQRVSIQGGISGELLDIAQDTWQDILTEVWKPQGNLIEKWYEYKQDRERAERRFRDFETYLKGAIQNSFWGHLRKRKRLKEEVTMDLEEARSWLKEEGGKLPTEEIPIEDEVCFYWDQLLRCRSPNPDEVEQELIQVRREASTVLVWACAHLKRELRGRGQARELENLQAFIAFYCSQRGPRRDRPPASALSPDRLGLEQVAGQYFRWEEDICRGIFHKSIRKDRVMRQIRDTLLESPYRDMIQ